MALYRNELPQLQDKVFITDAGLETELVFKHNIELPEFAAYTLLKNETGYGILYDYFASFAELARQHQFGVVIETPTWRANQDWADKIGDNIEELATLNRQAVSLLEQLRMQYEKDNFYFVISGNLGPRGDGYTPGATMSTEQAKSYHLQQIQTFAGTAADLVTALTLNYVEEAIGITLAARECGMPVVISFTLETDGLLPTGQTLQSAIESVDAASQQYPVYYMINCAHPNHFRHILENNEDWSKRIRGIRCNASRCSHKELDNATELDDGDPLEFGSLCSDLRQLNPQLNILGGCCGTDRRHIESICRNVN